MNKQIITSVNGRPLSEEAKKEIVKWLVMAGYTVRLAKAKDGNKTKTVIEYWEEK